MSLLERTLQSGLSHILRSTPVVTVGGATSLLTSRQLRAHFTSQSKKRVAMEGNTAAAHVAYAMSDSTFLYPITPSSTMGQYVDEWAVQGRKNIFGNTVRVKEMQSEGGAAGAVHGALLGGSLATTFTASQGLLLMIPNMYKISGELLPAVFHVASRVVAQQVLSIFGDHSDVMAARQTGFAMLSSGSVQEIMDLAAVAHLAAVKTRVPFLHFFEGFRMSSEYNTIDVLDYDMLKEMADWEAINAFRARALNPEHPTATGSSYGPDTYFQLAESANPYYDVTPQIVEDMMRALEARTGRRYNLFDYVGHPEADRVVVMLGSGANAAVAASEYLNSRRGEKVGVVKVRLYRPFSIDHLVAALPKSVKRVAVLDRTKERGSVGEPLYLDVNSALCGRNIEVVGGRYGVGMKEFNPSMAKAVFDNLNLETPKNHFTIGINDDVTHLSLPFQQIEEEVLPEGTRQCVFYGMGSDGTVSANKTAVKIIVEDTGKEGQAYFSYSSHKAGSLTVSHLRFGDKHIEAPYLIQNADYAACHQPVFTKQNGLEMVRKVKKGGIVVLNTPWNTAEEMEANLPKGMLKVIADRELKLYNIDAVSVALHSGLESFRINMPMQTAFFSITDIIPIDQAIEHLKKDVAKNYEKRGQAIVEKNQKAIDLTLDAIVRVETPVHWANFTESDVEMDSSWPSWMKELHWPYHTRKGDKVPVSGMVAQVDGRIPTATSKHLKRGIAFEVPEWDLKKCDPCNVCSLVCPHSAIRPFLLTNDEAKDPNKPEAFKTKKDGRFNLRIQVSPMDCTGCGVCSTACPSNALPMKPFQEQVATEKKNWDYALTVPAKDEMFWKRPKFTLKDTQYLTPLLEFPGACPGCGETPYVKLLTQLYGREMVIANATGCSTVWSRMGPFCFYTTDPTYGFGPVWGNSLFEDNAEYGFGMAMALKQRREDIYRTIDNALNGSVKLTKAMSTTLSAWEKSFKNTTKSFNDTKKVREVLKEELVKHREGKGEEASDLAFLKDLERNGDILAKKSVWLIGGDGWAYDIGYGGLDHVLASGEDINVLVMDTEMYSNTGGQESKASPLCGITKFAAHGKNTPKKDLGAIAMMYENVYVASVSLHANKDHVLKVVQDAENYPGVSIVIAYGACVSHAFAQGRNSGDQMKEAVECGYWPLYRRDPQLLEKGQNPLKVEYKPNFSKLDKFLSHEARFTALKNSDPVEYEKKKELLYKDIVNKYERLQRLAKSYDISNHNHVES